MSIRCQHLGLSSKAPYLSAEAAIQLREEIDQYINQKIKQWYETTPKAKHLFEESVNEKYYIRNLIETVLRIRLLRVSEGKALAKIAAQSPRAAQIWANYQFEEMMHDKMFLKDLAAVKVKGNVVINTEPFLETKLLSGYFSYLLDHEGPLGVVVYSYLVEYVNVKEEGGRINALKKSVGEKKIQGQIAHARTDEHEDHPGEVWDAIRHLIRGQKDIDAIKIYIDEFQEILALYFTALAREVQ